MVEKSAPGLLNSPVPYLACMGLYFRHQSSFAHDTGAHPENASRIVAIERTLVDADWVGMDLLEAPLATRGQLELVHTAAHIDRIERFCAAGGGSIDPDTPVVLASWEAALRAAGAVAEGADRLLAGESSFAFTGLRPPGHHAESARAMGFCLFNSAAVGAAHAIESGKADRVLILDWDVHHGNGTEEIFAGREEVLYVSIHQSPFYPGTGDSSEIGFGSGEGFTINLPVSAGAGGEEFLGLIQHVVLPVARSYEPGLLLVSAGYDAHVADPLANCSVGTGDFGAMAAAVGAAGRELGVPVLVSLEGGYAPEALADSVLATLRSLNDPVAPDPLDPVEVVEQARRRVASIDRWSSALGPGS